jgi:hypothetical protein
MDFKKFQILDRKPKMLAFGFTKKCQFVAKTDRNYIFLRHEFHIPDQLYIMDHYTCFYGCFMPFCDKNRPKLYISSQWIPYSGLIVHNDLLHMFLRHFVAKIDLTYIFLGREAQIPKQLYIMVCWTSFYIL